MTDKEKSLHIAELENELKTLPKGNVFYKKIKGKEQPYLQWYENGKTRTKYLTYFRRSPRLLTKYKGGDEFGHHI